VKFLAWCGSARVSSIATGPAGACRGLDRRLNARAGCAGAASGDWASRENKRLWSLELDFDKSHRPVCPVHDVVLDPGRPVIGLPRG